MSNSTRTFDQLVQSQASKEVTVNAMLDALSQASVYGRRETTCVGLYWGYYGGNVTKLDGTMTQIANGTVLLTASLTNYVVAKKVDGVVSAATSTTNWNNLAEYWRLYSVVAGTSTITSYTDSREIGRILGGDSSTKFRIPVTKTTAFTVADYEDEIIVNGSASVTATLPSASAYPGRSIRIKTRAAFTVISASSNVKPLDTDTAGTAILPALAGRWADLVSDGANWVVMAQGSDDGAFVAPVTKTGNFTLAAAEQFVICNGSASITATLPAASAFPGRRIVLKTIAAFTVVSASSNVVPLDTATAGTAILAATAGKWAELVSDGSNWVIMSGN